MLRKQGNAIAFSSNKFHVPAGIEHFHDAGDRFGNVVGDIGTVLSGIDGLDKVDQFIADAFSVQLIEIALVFFRVFIPDLEIIRLPPGGGDIDISFGPGDDQFAFRLDSAPDLQ